MEIKEVLNGWDELVESSPQGNIFSSTKWLKLINVPYKLIGCYKNNNLVGGVVQAEPAPLTPFQGILVRESSDMKYTTRMSLHNEIATSLLDKLPKVFYNHYSYPDLRPFKWAGKSVDIRYTYVVDLSDMDKLWLNLEKSTRYDITQSDKEHLSCYRIETIEPFIPLYERTFERKGLEVPVDAQFLMDFWWQMNPMIFATSSLDGIHSMAIFIEDNKRAYYILGASDGGNTSSFTLWTAFDYLSKYHKEVDLVGANTQSIALFKKGMAGQLTPYFGCYV